MVNSASEIPFNNSSFGTLGVEMEWMCVDSHSGKQIPAAPQVFSVVGDTPRIKPELFTSIVETNTDIQFNTPDAMAQLAELYEQVDAVLKNHEAALLSSGTPPISHWR